MRSSLLRRLLREPLTHFVLIGGLLAAGYRVVHRARGGPLVITAEQRQRLRVDFSRRTGQQPSSLEERALLDRHVEDELLLREAERLHLGEGDVIIRRRLLQKMQLLLDAKQPAPTEAELAAYFDANRARYAAQERVDLVLLDRAPDGSLRGSPLGGSLRGRSQADLAKQFGDAFAAAVFALPIGGAPTDLRSTIGLHQVVVESRQAPPVSLATRRGEVEADLRRERSREHLGAELATLKRRYPVELQ